MWRHEKRIAERCNRVGIEHFLPLYVLHNTWKSSPSKGISTIVSKLYLDPVTALVVLDLDLSGQKPIEGLSRQLRRESKEVPIFVLGSTSEVADRVSMLDLGAGDFITKPFDRMGSLARATTRANWSTRRGR
jgi:DNA-binding response OmpR family regulator